MTDILGPASALNAVAARPSDGRQYGAVDTFFKDCSSASTQDGTQVSAAWLNQVIGALRAIARAVGLKLDGVTPVVPYDQSDNMPLNAILQLIQRGQSNFAVDKGTADAMLATPAVAVAEYLPGMRFLVLKNPGVGANATATPTINFGLGNLTVTKGDASAISAGDLRRSGLFEVEIDGAGNARIVSLLTTSDVLALIPAAAVAAVSANKNLIPFAVGTSTWTSPANITKVKIYGRGGGGSGGGCAGGSGSASYAAGGGGGGSYFIGTFTVVPGMTYTVIVGAGGALGNSATANGNPGGATSFGTLATAYGGAGGGVANSSYPANSGGSGGPASSVPSGVLAYAGSPGSPGQSVSGTGEGGAGGGSYGQGATNLAAIGLGSGINGQMPGIGGNGGGGGAYTGGGGGNGELVLEI